MQVVDLMTTDVITVSRETGIRDAARLMFRNRVSGLPVTSPDGSLVGIITEADFVTAEAKLILRILREGAFQYIDQDCVQDELAQALIDHDLLTENASSADPRVTQAQLRIQVIRERKGKVRTFEMAEELLKLYAERTASVRDPIESAGTAYAEFEATLGPLEDQARRAATVFLVRIAVLGLAGGLAAVLLFPRRTRRLLLRCGLGGLLATVLLLGPALATYDLTVQGGVHLEVQLPAEAVE